MVAVYLDENANPRVAAGLRRLGITVSTTQSARQLARADEEQLAWAAKLGAIFFSHDIDFLRICSLKLRRGEPFPGIIYAHSRKYGVGVIIRKVAAIARVNTFQTAANRIFYI